MIRRLIAAMLMCLAAPATAQVDPGALTAWADTQFGKPVSEGRASAATVVVVQRGNIVLVRTYGHGDRAKNTPIAPPRDRFLIASTTKTFTATAIALLLHDGKIASLDDPANKYLKRLKLPDGFGRPVTIRQLLTHSAGYEERGFGVGNHDDLTAPATPAYVRAHLPAIVRAPGSRIVYANIDPAILGMVVEDITGMTMRDFVATRILKPLGMADTELAYSADATARLVRPYTGNQAAPWDINAPFYAPTGSIHTTAADMAKYLNAQLGHVPGVLAPDVVARLHAPLARNAPTLDPLAMAFFVSRWNGHKIVGHAGAFSGFSADLYLVPDRDIGIFYVWAGGPVPGKGEPLDYGKLQASFLTLALGKYQPPAPLAKQPDPSAHYGRYWDERRPHTNFEAIVAAGAVQTVSPAPGNRLTINGKGPYYAFAPGSYTMINDDGRPANIVTFAGDEMRQRVSYARRVSGLGDPGNQTMLAMIALGVLASGLLGAIWLRGRPRLVALGVGMLGVAIPAMLFLWPGLESDIIGGRALRFQLMAVAYAAGLMLALWLGWLATRAGQRRLARVHGVVIAVAAVLLAVPLRFFHLI